MNNLQAQCPYCGAIMTAIEKIRPGHCKNPECMTQHAIKGDAIRQAALLEEYRGEVACAKEVFQQSIDELALANGVAPDRVHVGAVPHLDIPLTRLPEERRLDYLAHLATITEAAFALPPPTPQDIDRDYESERSEPYPWNAVACGTCRGFCCHAQGAKAYAFQRVDTITELRRAQPDLSAEDVIALYTDALPEVSTDGGCVFQGPVGCVLERSQRSDICNTFRCYALNRLAKDIDPAATDAVALVSVAGETPHRTTLCVKPSG